MLEFFIVILGIAAAYAFFEWLDRRELYGRDYERCEVCGRKLRGEERVEACFELYGLCRKCCGKMVEKIEEEENGGHSRS